MDGIADTLVQASHESTERICLPTMLNKRGRHGRHTTTRDGVRDHTRRERRVQHVLSPLFRARVVDERASTTNCSAQGSSYEDAN